VAGTSAAQFQQFIRQAACQCAKQQQQQQQQQQLPASWLATAPQLQQLVSNPAGIMLQACPSHCGTAQPAPAAQVPALMGSITGSLLQACTPAAGRGTACGWSEQPQLGSHSRQQQLQRLCRDSTQQQ
jgi:hypothetical protein